VQVLVVIHGICHRRQLLTAGPWTSLTKASFDANALTKCALSMCALVFAVAAAGLSSAHGQFAEGRFESVEHVRASEVLSPSHYRSTYHRVLDDVTVGENAFSFRVESDQYTFQVTTGPMLRLRLHEIKVLAQAAAEFNRRDGALGAQLRGALSVRGNNIGELISSPLHTAASLAGQLGSNVRETLGANVQRPNSRAGSVSTIDEGDPIAAAHRRNIASQLGLDVYSTNPRVQSFLRAVVRARESGDVGAGITIMAPRYPLGVRVADGAIAGDIDRLVRRLSAGELNAAVAEELLAMEVPRSQVKRFVESKAFSPRRRLSVAAHLDFIGNIPGRELLVAVAIGASTEPEALAYQEMVRLFARYHEEVARLRSFVISAGFPSAVDGGNALVVALPVDLLQWDQALAAVARKLDGTQNQRGYQSVRVLLTGDATAKARSALGQRGIEVATHYLGKL
jgi:hypothetical protein